jgi:hypothetical protein
MPDDRLPDRIASKIRVNTDTGCWEWTASIGSHGYGQVHYERKMHTVHRLLYMLLVGPVPEGLQLDHLCRNRPCCNPEHLEIVTHRQNSLRDTGAPAHNAKKIACPQGHPYDRTSKRGYRFCSICTREYGKQYRKKNIEQIREYNKEYYKDYYQKNKDRLREYGRNRRRQA